MEIKEYLDNVIIANFKLLIDKNFHSSIINLDHEIIACTNLSAREFGFKDCEELVKYRLTAKDYNNQEVARHLFKGAYNNMNAEQIHQYAYKLYLLQEYIFETGNVVSFIDMLPYNNQFKTYLVVIIPIYHNGQEIVALQSFSNETRIFHFQDYVPYQDEVLDLSNKVFTCDKALSEKEHGLMFLLSHGLTQEQCANVLGNSRSTVATMIHNLCIKFGVFGSNSKALQQIAFQNGFHKTIPHSLWKPCVIITDMDAVSYINKKISKK
jgi:DNA-binding CsgD family transcriptional regulator